MGWYSDGVAAKLAEGFGAFGCGPEESKVARAFMFKVIVGDAGGCNMGDYTVSDGPTFTTIDKALRWVEKQGGVILKDGQLRMDLKDGQSRLGERDYKIVPVEVDP